MPDYTGARAPDRVLHINLGIFRYGTNDKVHAAAVVFSLLLLIILVGIFIYGAYAGDKAWAQEAFRWVGSTFLFVTGVALGKGGSDHPHPDSKNSN